MSLEKKTQNQDQKLFYLLGLVIFNHVELEIVFLSSSVIFFFVAFFILKMFLIFTDNSVLLTTLL